MTESWLYSSIHTDNSLYCLKEGRSGGFYKTRDKLQAKFNLKKLYFTICTCYCYPVLIVTSKSRSK